MSKRGNDLSLNLSNPVQYVPYGSESVRTPGQDFSPVQDIADRDHRHFSRVDERDLADHRKNVYVGLHMSTHSVDELTDETAANRHHHHHQRHHHRRHHNSRSHRHHHKHRHRSNSANGVIPMSSNITETNDLQAPGERVRTLLSCTGEEGVVETHDLFTELEELKVNDGVLEWKETARWVKYEEDVEWGGEKWSKPHVAALSLHSLFELRSCILQGTVLLNMSATDLTSIADLVLDDLVASDQLEESNKHLVRTALLCRHTHQNQHRSKLLRRNTHDDPSKMYARSSSEQAASELSKPAAADVGPLRQMSLPENSPSSARKQAADLHFMKKLPPNAEASNVLVGQVDFLTRPLIAFVRLAESVVLGDLTEVPLPTRFIFILLGPKGEEERYHEIGRSISTLMSDPIFHNVAYRASCRDDLMAGVDEFLDQVVVLPPGEWDPTIRLPPPSSPRKASERLLANASAPIPSREKPQPGHGGGSDGGGDGEDDDPGKDLQHAGLERTKRCFGGLVGDVKRRWPWYFWSDFTDAIHPQILPSIIFIFFASIAPTVTFGGLLEESTNGYMGTMETIVAACFCGVVYSLFSGQPLTILGATGPMLVFEGIVFTFSESNNLPFLQFRFWIGMWTAGYLILMVAFDVSALIRYFTRFTEEAFSVLISFIFIYEALSYLNSVQKSFPSHGSYNYNTALEYHCSCLSNGTSLGQMPSDLNFSTCTSVYNGTAEGRGCPLPTDGAVFFVSFIELFGTFLVIFYLKKMRNTRYFPTLVRTIVSDFAVVLGIVCMLAFDLVFDVPTPKLNIPSEFEPTRSADRGWIISPTDGISWWLPLAAAIPALLAAILAFMDQQITALLVNRREHKLKKGPGYHLDLLVVAFLFAGCSLFGLPWFVAATVRSVTHVNSLSIMDSNTAPGEKPKFLGVREQRVSAFVVFFLHGLAVLAAPALQRLPLPVLYGLFLYMGVASLQGVQFVQRIELLFMPQKFQYDLYYVRHVPIRRMHLFTVAQCVALGLLFAVKLTPASIIFPIAVLGLVPVRHFLKYLFTSQELEILDDKMPDLIKKKTRPHTEGADQNDRGANADDDDAHSDIIDAEQILPVTQNATPSTALRHRSSNGSATQPTFNLSDAVNRSAVWQHTQQALNQHHHVPPVSSSEQLLTPRSAGKTNGYEALPIVHESAL